MEQALKTLEDLVSRLDSNRYSFEEKLGYISEFLEGDAQDIISAIEDGIEKVEDLEEELIEANKRIEELERELDEAV